MKTIARFVADDGREFKTAEACGEYESQCREIADLADTLMLKPRPEGTDFANGGGFIPQSPVQMMEFKRGLVEIAKRLYPETEVFRHEPVEDTHPMSSAGRALSDGHHKPLYSAWYRLMCTDEQGREWGQPYFALNPDKGDQHEYAQAQPDQEPREGLSPVSDEPGNLDAQADGDEAGQVEVGAGQENLGVGGGSQGTEG